MKTQLQKDPHPAFLANRILIVRKKGKGRAEEDGSAGTYYSIKII